MTGFDFGDVVLVPFPFTDQTTTKKRPAVVVSSRAYHQNHADVIVMAITSQDRAANFGEVFIVDWPKAGLLKTSVVKPVLATLEASLVLRKLGALETQDRDAVRAALKIILG